MGSTVIFSPVADPRLVTVRRGGGLSDADHHLLALWAAECAEHVLALFEAARPHDHRPAEAIEAGRAWTRGELGMMATRALGGHAMGAARDLAGAPRFAAYAAGQAACVAHAAAPTTWARPRTRSRPRRPPLPRPRPTPPDAANAPGSASGCPPRCVSWCSTTSGCAIRCAGTCSTRGYEQAQPVGDDNSARSSALR